MDTKFAEVEFCFKYICRRNEKIESIPFVCGWLGIVLPHFPYLYFVTLLIAIAILIPAGIGIESKLLFTDRLGLR